MNKPGLAKDWKLVCTILYDSLVRTAFLGSSYISKMEWRFIYAVDYLPPAAFPLELTETLH